jgi:hypothetical protein
LALNFTFSFSEKEINMGLWKTRHKSMEVLAKSFKPQAQTIERTFEIIDQCIELFDRKAGHDDFHRICGLTVAKARNYALGSYGLILDGLAQEAGALLRPLFECYELLIYYKEDPVRVQQAIEGNLPSAGKRAKLIKGKFQDLRDYLNIHASHISYSYYSLNHLFIKPDMRIRKEQPMLPDVLFRNMGYFFLQLTLLTFEAVNCLQSREIGYADEQEKNILLLREEGMDVFRFDEWKPRFSPK